jgi:hypothetical protein
MLLENTLIQYKMPNGLLGAHLFQPIMRNSLQSSSTKVLPWTRMKPPTMPPVVDGEDDVTGGSAEGAGDGGGSCGEGGGDVGGGDGLLGHSAMASRSLLVNAKDWL